MRSTRVLGHSAPWMKGKAVKRKGEMDQRDGAKVLLTGVMHGARAPGLSLVNTGRMLDGVSVKEVNCGAGHAVLVMENGVVATFGDNRHGQCGGEQHKDVYIATHTKTLKVYDALQGRDVKATAGARHTFIYTPGTRDIYSCGENNLCQQGVPGYQDVFSAPNELGVQWTSDIPHTEGGIVKLSSSTTHTLMLMESGSVYVFGCANDGQLGTGNIVAHSAPFKLKFFEAKGLRVTEFCAGASCSLFLTECQQVFGCGKLDEGRLGLPWTKQKPVTLLPKKVPLPLFPAHFSSGLAHTTCVAADGTWFGFGGSQKLGLSLPMCKDISDIRHSYNTDAYDEPHAPRLFQEDLPVVSLSSGNYHTAGLTEDGAVVGTGWNSDKQLAGNEESFQDALTLLHHNPDVAAVAAGGTFTVIVINATPATPDTWSDLPIVTIV